MLPSASVACIMFCRAACTVVTVSLSDEPVFG